MMPMMNRPEPPMDDTADETTDSFPPDVVETVTNIIRRKLAQDLMAGISKAKTKAPVATETEPPAVK